MGRSRRERKRTTMRAAPLDSSNIDEAEPIIVATEDAASKDESYASLLGTTFSVFLQVDLFD